MIYSVENLRISPETIDFFTLMDWTNEVYVEQLLSPPVRRKYWLERMKRYPNTINKIRRQLRGQKIFVSVSIVPYQSGSTIYYEDLANIVVGPLKPRRVGGSKQCFLLKSSPIRHDYANCPKTFLRDLFNEAMNLLWPQAGGELHRKDVLLLITENCDSTFWQERLQVAMEELSPQYPSMIHQTCMYALLKKLKTQVRSEVFPEVSSLFLAMRSFLQFKLNAAHFYEQTQLPQVPHEFFNACCYYSEYFDIIKSFWFNVDNFDEYDDYSHMQALFADCFMMEDLNMIVQTFSSVPHLQRLIQQKPTVPLVEVLNGIQQLRHRMDSLAKWTRAAKAINERFVSELESTNSGYLKLVAISSALLAAGEVEFNSFPRANLLQNLLPSDISLFRYAPVGGVNRQYCFPKADETIREHLKAFPLRYIEYTSVNYCFGKAGDKRRRHKLDPIGEDFEDL